MIDNLEEIRTHFNIILNEESLELTLINPNITPETINNITNNLTLISHLKTIEIVIIQCPNFDDQLLTILAKGMPRSLKELSLDFTGCESLRGEGFLELFQRIDGLQLTKLSLDLGSVFDINDIVMEGLALLLSNLIDTLEYFYLDLYEIDQITQEGYLLLAEATSSLQKLQYLYIDLSANYNLTEDSLEILFAGNYQNLKHFTLKILDTEEIGGGSFFKLAESLEKMTQINELNLTISTFANINHKGVYNILRSISRLQTLKKMKLNFSDIVFPQKMITYLNFNPNLQELSLDISCNPKITFQDFLNLGTKIKKIKKLELNLDFCTNITQDTIEEVIGMICNQNKCFSLSLSDRNYSTQLQNNILPSLLASNSLFEFNLSTKNVTKKLKVYENYLLKKKKLLYTILLARRKDYSYLITRVINDQLFFCI